VFFRLGAEYPKFYPNTAFPKAGLEQFFRATIPSVTEDADVVSDGFVALLEKIGPAVLVAHSQSGPFAMLAAIKSPLVRAIYTYEPAGMIFPEGEPRPPIVLGDGSVRRGDRQVPAADFLKLTRIPIHVVYGDNIPTEPDSLNLRDFRRAQALAGRQFVDVVNRHGGDATFVSLPDEGLVGNTHFMFFDTNHIQVADLLSKFLSDKGLDER
jgi:pimeloyl-ACP methyl ester carboxylesterase